MMQRTLTAQRGGERGRGAPDASLSGGRAGLWGLLAPLGGLADHRAARRVLDHGTGRASGGFSAGTIRTTVRGTSRHSLTCRVPQEETVIGLPCVSVPAQWASGMPCVRGSAHLKRGPSLRGAPRLPVGGGAGR